jgi:hypothetical protein
MARSLLVSAGLLAVVGMLCIVAALITLTQNASAPTATKGLTHGPGAPPTSSTSGTSSAFAPLACSPDWTVVPSPDSEAANDLIAVAAISASDVWAVGDYSYGSTSQTLILHWNGNAWNTVSSPNSGRDHNDLLGVTAVSASDVWAVGFYDNGDVNQTLIMHWNGSEWSVVPSPNPGLSGSSLHGVAAVSSSNVWAVGDYFYALDQTLIMHWNGSAWSVVSSPDPSTTINYLYGVAAISASDVWAVGDYSVGGSIYRTLIMHWNGSAWSVISSPDPSTGANYLYGVAAISASDVWAVGAYDNGDLNQTLILHWNGSAWSVVASPNGLSSDNRLYGITAVSANDVWAVGYYYTRSVDRTLMEHWNGDTWSVVSSPNSGTSDRLNTLYGVAAVSASDVWAVGYSYYYSEPYRRSGDQTVTLNWNGNSWSVVPSPDPADRSNYYLRGVAAISANDVWAVGYYYDGNVNQTHTLHWDGSKWSVVATPNGSTSDNALYGVAAVSANDVWAVGYYYNGNVNQTLTLHWNGSIWSVVSSPNSGTSYNELHGVAAVSANDVWAVGYYYNGKVEQTLILHWNGSAWSVVSSPNSGTNSNFLHGVAAVSANDLWAVGYYIDNNAARTLILHWNGSIWSVAPSPDPSTTDNGLEGVTALSASDVWAVGSYYYESAFQTLILHWNGSAWSIVSSPNLSTSYNELYGVAAVSVNDVWAIGSYVNDSTYTRQTLILHWNGNAWSVMLSPNPSTSNNELHGVAVASAGDLWAVGYYNNNGIDQSLVERYNPCPSACPVQFADLPNPSTFYEYIECLACRDIISGYACGGSGEPCNPSHDPYFRPNANITRGQIAKMVALSAQINNPASGQTFEDVPPGSTFYTYTEQLYALGAMAGYPCGNPEPCVPPNNRPYFRPNANATRGQLAKIDSNAAGYIDTPIGKSFQDVPAGSTFYTYTQRLAKQGVMGGYPCGGAGEPCIPPNNYPYFRPNARVTRGQTSKIVANTFYPDCQPPRKR